MGRDAESDAKAVNGLVAETAGGEIEPPVPLGAVPSVVTGRRAGSCAGCANECRSGCPCSSAVYVVELYPVGVKPAIA